MLKEREAGVSVAEARRFSDAKWKVKCSRMEVSEAKRLKALDDDNPRLKR